MRAFPDISATVFVVDDDEVIRDSIKVFLEAQGFEVEEFGSPAEFARSHRKRPRCCLILDHWMQPTTGLDFLESSAGTELGIPVILITGASNSVIEQRARAARVVLLEKPVPPMLLIDQIRRMTGPS